MKRLVVMLATLCCVVGLAADRAESQTQDFARSSLLRNTIRRPTVRSLHSLRLLLLHQAPGRNRPRAKSPKPTNRMIANATIRINRSSRPVVVTWV